jgi:hypothetical protein
MGRELMRTPAPVVGGRGVDAGTPEATRDEPGARARIEPGGTAAALRDPRVRAAIGNRAVGRMLARQPAPRPTKMKPEPKSGTEFHIPGNQYEVALAQVGPSIRQLQADRGLAIGEGREDAGARWDEHLAARG